MSNEGLVDPPGFRFGLRSLLLLVTGFCLIAGMFWFVSPVLLLLFGVLLAQCVFFLVFQKFVNWIGGNKLAETDEAE
ncbi:MAG: hypothetical protein H0T51_06875 [Pirellulales bacterium]|nr:hypothetical protein [Pirellulales bacterium]